MPRSCSECHLLTGNKRFVRSKKYAKERQEAAEGHEPCSVIVCCCDSRVPPEIVFDQLALGEMFVVRTAGHVLDDAAKESIKYAVEHLHARQVLVMGHQQCGAVKAVWEDIVHGKPNCPSFPTFCKYIAPSVQNDPKKSDARNINASIKANVLRTVRKVVRVVEKAHGDPNIVHGSYYHLKSGQVRWLCTH